MYFLWVLLFFLPFSLLHLLKMEKPPKKTDSINISSIKTMKNSGNLIGKLPKYSINLNKKDKLFNKSNILFLKCLNLTLKTEQKPKIS
jgi:hypothetical protein